MDMGGHCLDLLEMFFGPVKSVSCFTSRTVHIENHEPLNSAASGLQSQRVLAACYESARTGTVREINPSASKEPHPYAQISHPQAS